LEIFAVYHQLHELRTDYEKVWNSRDGWFKLAHVCRHWRRVVFSSSSRLHVRLLFTPGRSSRDPIFSGLPRFPILFDYRSIESWDTEKEDNIGLAIVRHQSRVRGIAIRRPCQPAGLLKALTQPFLGLESFIFESSIWAENQPHVTTDFLVAVLLGSAPSLRRLTLQEVELARLSPLLSSTPGLEKLALTLWVTPGTHPEVLFIPNLQRMSCLRRLELKFLMRHDRVIETFPNPPLPAGARDVVPLPRLTDFIFAGHSSCLQILATRLVAPSLQHLDAEYYSDNAISPLPQLCKFICYSDCQFKAVLLYLSESVRFGGETSYKSGDGQPAFRISIPVPIPWEQIGQMLSGPLSTVEELVVGWGFPGPQYDHIDWRALLIHIPQVKVVQVDYQVALGVADAFQLNGQEPALDLLPSLEYVNVQFPPSILEYARNISYIPIRDAFEPLIAARQQVGCPINLSMNSPAI
jgi:hypothetical protein